jgi:pyruvate dehydrogenase E2 component (dihydrolipoamide acetyltransferase)
VETDKATTELESIAEGLLLKQLVPEGALAGSGSPVAWIGAPGESVEETAAPPEATRRVAPIVANLALKLGVDLGGVTGTGAGGAITREDVLKADKGGDGAKRTAPSRVQDAVARAVARSNAEIPHLRVAASIEMSAVEPARKGKAFYDAVFLKAIALAAGTVPLSGTNARGIALAIDRNGGLYLPVVQDPAKKPLSALAGEIEGLVTRAVSGTLPPDEPGGASIALSNLGMYPVDWFEAMIFPGHSMIVALGRVEDRPVAMNGVVGIRRMATVVVSADHRAINGRAAAEFLAALKHIVESGQILLL